MEYNEGKIHYTGANGTGPQLKWRPGTNGGRPQPESQRQPGTTPEPRAVKALELQATRWTLVLPPYATLYGRTAAEWYGTAAPRTEDFHVIVPPGVVPVRRPGLVPHEGLGEDDWQLRRGVRVTTPARTFLDLATDLSRDQLVVLGDDMVRLGLANPDDLRVAAAAAYRKRGVVRARDAAALVRSGVDSPPETRVRLILIQGGLPCPEPGLDIFDEAGGWLGRPDLTYRELMLALQYEGDVHRTNRKRWRTDIRRDEVLLDHGWDVVRLTGDDLRRPIALCERVRVRMRRQARRLGVAWPDPAPDAARPPC